MKQIKLVIMIISSLVFLSSCSYPRITGTVVESETGKPIEGAVVLVEWSKTKGLPGLTYSKTYKIVELLTDENGKFSVLGVLNPSVNPPIIVIYKKGYVAWRNDFIFPGWEKRSDFKPEDEIRAKLELFKDTYSRDAHYSFIRLGINDASLEKTPLYFKAKSEALRESLKEIENNKRR